MIFKRKLPDGFEVGKQFLKVVVVSTWKSGSTLITDIVASHPSSFLMYEPLSHYGIERTMGPINPNNTQQIKMVEDILNCKFQAFKSESIQKLNKARVGLLTLAWRGGHLRSLF